MSNAATMLIATAPAKVQPFLTRAHDRGLTIDKDDVSYAITSPNPIDDWAVWLYYTAGPNGGRLTIRRYIPGHGHTKDKNHKITRQMAQVTIDMMAEALDRHRARENNKILTNVGQPVDKSGPGVILPTIADQPPAPKPILAQYSSATVAKVTGTVPVRVPTVALAQPAETPDPAPVLAGLRANGRFAIRAARHGHIQRNTPAKVVSALINRGLIQAGGYMLTDLGRAARQHLVGA